MSSLIEHENWLSDRVFEEFTQTGRRNKEKRRNAIVSLMKWNVMYRVCRKFFLRVANFLQPCWRDRPLPQPLPGQQCLNRLKLTSSKEFPRTPEGYHQVIMKFPVNWQGWKPQFDTKKTIIKTTTIIPRNSGEWRIVFRPKGTEQVWDYFGFSNAFLLVSSKGSNNGHVTDSNNKFHPLGCSLNRDDIIVLTIDTTKSSGSILLVRDNSKPHYIPNISISTTSKSFEFVMIFSNEAHESVSHYEILRVQQLSA